MASNEASKKILVVDNDETITSMFECILNPLGYEVTSVFTGEDGISAVLSEPNFRLIFLDVRMPGRSGLDILGDICKINPKIPVLLMSGFSIDSLFQEGFSNGAYGVMYKPFDVDEVLSILNKVFKKGAESCPA